MKKVIYCECGWAGIPEQLVPDETINNETVKVCPRCGTSFLPAAVNVNDETFNSIMRQQLLEMEDRNQLEDEDE